MTIKRSIAAGVLIGIAGLAYVKTGYAFLFSIGLLAILRLRLDLYTGKVCDWRNVKPGLAVVWFGNLIGTLAVAMLSRQDVSQMIAAKMQKPPVTALCDAVICGMCIAIAVKADSQLITVLSVVVFILVGAEHCVADMYYFWLDGMSFRKMLFIFVVTGGNTVGGLIAGCMIGDKR